MDDRFEADADTRRELDGVKARTATFDEYAAVADVRVAPFAFEPKLDGGEYRVVLLATYRSPKAPGVAVSLLGDMTVIATRRSTVAFLFDGLRVKAAVVDNGRASASVGERDVGDVAQAYHDDPTAVGTSLPPVADSVRRFVVKRFVFENAARAVDMIADVECCIVPADKLNDANTLRSAIVAAETPAK